MRCNNSGYLLVFCFVFFGWTAPGEITNIITLTNADSLFIIESHFHPIVNMSWLFLFCSFKSHFLQFLSKLWFSFGLSLCKFHSSQSVSHSSVTNINSSFDTFVYFSFFLFSRHVACFTRTRLCLLRSTKGFPYWFYIGAKSLTTGISFTICD